jgi:hypothetical protein
MKAAKPPECPSGFVIGKTHSAGAIRSVRSRHAASEECPVSQKQFIESNGGAMDSAPGIQAESSNQIGSDRWVLHSWKQVSAYMGLSVRTIQRYEIQFRLPVHRASGKKRSAVLAFTDELDAWLQNTPTLHAPPPSDSFTMPASVSAKQDGRTSPAHEGLKMQHLKAMA